MQVWRSTGQGGHLSSSSKGRVSRRPAPVESTDATAPPTTRLPLLVMTYRTKLRPSPTDATVCAPAHKNKLTASQLARADEKAYLQPLNAPPFTMPHRRHRLRARE